MTRPLRILYPGAVYHVMNRGLARQPIFRTAADREAFLATVAEAHAVWGIEVAASCRMDTHYPLGLRTPEPTLPRVMRHVHGLYTQRFNRAHRREGPWFRGRYRALCLAAEASRGAVVRDVPRNPVEATRVRDPGAFRWSSHRASRHPRRRPPWLRVDPLLRALGGPRGFHAYVLAGHDATLAALYHKPRLPPLRGAEAFRAALRRPARPPHREHGRPERQLLRPPVAEVSQVVAGAYAVPPAALLAGRRGRRQEARQVALWLVKTHGDLTQAETARHFGLGSPGSARWVCGVIRQRLHADRHLRRRLAELEGALLPRTIHPTTRPLLTAAPPAATVSPERPPVVAPASPFPPGLGWDKIPIARSSAVQFNPFYPAGPPPRPRACSLRGPPDKSLLAKCHNLSVT